MSLLNELFGVNGFPKTNAERGKNIPMVTFGRASKDIQDRQKEIIKNKQDQKNNDKKTVVEFDNGEDFILSLILIGLMYLNPDVKPEKAIDAGQTLLRNLSLPNKIHKWQKQMVRINKIGYRAEAGKIRRELLKVKDSIVKQPSGIDNTKIKGAKI